MKSKIHIKTRQRLRQLLACTLFFPVSGIALSAAPDKINEALYLTIVATETEQLSAITKHQSLSKQFKQLSVISSNDCSNLKPGLVLYVSHTSHNETEAQKHLVDAKALVADSYLRKCNMKPDSLLAHDQTYIHPSVFNLPNDTINWSFDDIKSELITINKDYSVLIERTFNQNINDEAEGRQTSIYYLDHKSPKPQMILNQCWDFSAPLVNNKILVFQCMTAMAADHYIHTVYAHDLKHNNTLFKKEFCQQGSIKNNSLITCLEEAVDATGELKLTPREYLITQP